MAEEKIIISFDESGGSSIEVQGVKGRKCLALTEDLERALGKVEERKRKPEFFASVEDQARITTGRGGSGT